jgi:hypothetical protein
VTLPLSYSRLPHLYVPKLELMIGTQKQEHEPMTSLIWLRQRFAVATSYQVKCSLHQTGADDQD